MHPLMMKYNKAKVSDQRATHGGSMCSGALGILHLGAESPFKGPL